MDDFQAPEKNCRKGQKIQSTVCISACQYVSAGISAADTVSVWCFFSVLYGGNAQAGRNVVQAFANI